MPDAELYAYSIENIGAFIPITLLSHYRERHGGKRGYLQMLSRFI